MNRNDTFIDPEYYTEINNICIILFKKELNLEVDFSFVSRTEKEKAHNRAIQLAFWHKFDMKNKMNNGYDLAFKYFCDNHKKTILNSLDDKTEYIKRKAKKYFDEIIHEDNWNQKRITDDNHQCEHCNKKDCKLKCSQCLYSYYCSTVCQKQDWKNHKIICKFLNRYYK